MNKVFSYYCNVCYDRFFIDDITEIPNRCGSCGRVMYETKKLVALRAAWVKGEIDIELYNHNYKHIIGRSPDEWQGRRT